MPRDLVLRAARAEDLQLLANLIRELAEFEGLAHSVSLTQADLGQALFGERAVAEATLAQWRGQVTGFVLYFPTFWSFQGCTGLYVEALFVRSAWRRKGIGQALLAHTAKLALERGAGRLDWAAIDHNKGAIAFYQGLGASERPDWRNFRLEGEALTELAGRA